MGIRLFVEVLDYAPAELTWRERYALSVLAETANDGTRECWPGIEDDPTIAQRMRLPARSSRYEVMKALRLKKALETVSAGRRGSRAVYRIPFLAPAQGPETSDPNEPTGSGNSGPNDGDSVRDSRTQTGKKGPENPDPNSEKGSGNDPDRVREPHGKGPETPDPFPSTPHSPQEEDSSSRADVCLEAFGAFWLTYPKKINRGKAQEQWIAEIRKGADPKQIVDAAQSYARSVAGKDPQFTSYPANWLRLERYHDEYPEPAPPGRPDLHVVDSRKHRPYQPPANDDVYANGL
ncbi:hypothetical protein OG594_08750 [Streptomyces sp. NBC_01214]|uniref:hypothetical protein n=1 Tax=Streptomyces sp. NBC_01214 TaxID=2903777 RepID=UPI00225845AC|nr:hypothetical protein [Streptomyces sp. NBC_01214]MCX4801738.1 hypothetical protein [Streptomyces sp. NBC_01214]